MKADSEMMRSLGIMDYSLLWGIEKSSQALAMSPMAVKVGQHMTVGSGLKH
jgi:hypothetical protein